MEGLQSVFSDPVTMMELQHVARLGWSLDKVRERAGEWKKRREAGQSLHLVVLCAQTGEVAGLCGFHEIVQEHQRGEFGIVLAAPFWGRGAGLESMLACLDFGFESLMLHRVEMNTSETNTKAIKFATRSGAALEGIRREYLLHDGRFYTFQCFGLLAHEWPAGKKRIEELLKR